MKQIKLLLIIGLIVFGLIITCGCTSSKKSGDSSVHVTDSPTENTYQDQEFRELVTESGDETVALLNDILDSANNLDADGVLIYGAGLKVAADNYVEECEALKVSPDFEQAQNYYIKALKEYSNAGYNYGTCGEYMGKLDYTAATEYLEKGTENVNSATEFINLATDSLP